ncbi:MAG TPA: amino acid adenylation domain-containing protein [Pyrinomonadaceae bacterium]|jgi:amino acid adenylation domain-containing protein
MQTQIEGYRLSPQQRRLWQLKQSGAGSAYSSQSAIVIEGPLVETDFKEAVYAIVDRHEILRTRLVETPGLRWPVQVVAGEQALSWNRLDLHNLSEQEQEARLAALYREEWKRACGDDAQEAQPRFLLVALSEERRVLLMTLPAHCADRRSLENIVREMAESYGACREDVKLSDEPVQYVQFSEWQNELLKGEDAEAGAEFWRRMEVESVQALSLPFEKRPETAAPCTTETIGLTLDAKTLSGINSASSRYEVTAETFLLACWQALLWRLTGQSEINIGRLLAGRNFEELYGALGLFAKYLPARVSIDDGARFSALLRQVGEASSEVEEWEDYFSFEQAQTPEGTCPQGFSAISFEYAKAPRRYTAQGVTFYARRQDVSFEQHKLSLVCLDAQDSLAVQFTYDSRLYTRAVVERLAGQYARLVESAVANPELTVARLEFLTADEKEQLLYAYNRTAAEYPRELCVHQLFEQQAEATPDTVALIFGDEQLTYAELNRRANQLARYLRRQGVGADVAVGLMLERSLEMVVGMLGVLKAGGYYVPLDPQYPQERVAFMLEDSRAGVLLTQEKHVETLPESAAKVISIDTGWQEIEREDGEQNVETVTTPDNLAYVIYTSGSTGKPKGVMVAHRGVVNYLSWAVRAYGVAEGSGAPVHSPAGFDLTVTSLYTPLLTGRSVTLIAEEEGVEGLSKTLRAGHNFSLVKITPAHLEVLREWLPEEELAERARTLVIGGEALFSENISYWRTHAPETRIVNEYGPTETVVGCCVYEVTKETRLAAGAVPIGRAIANTQLYLLDQHWQPVATGSIGELYIGGDGLARGYMNRPDMSAERFIPNPFSSSAGARLYRTGDLARYLPDGNLEFLGRNDAQVKVRGYRIELGEIEAGLTRHPEVREAVVLAREDVLGETRLVAYVVAERQDLQGHELRAYLKEHLPDYMIPSVFMMLDALPLTPNGKVDRRALPAPGSARPSMELAYVAPASMVEEVLASIWSEVLDIERVGVNDNFFDLGGDSIRSVRVVALGKERGLNLTVQQLFRSQTIAQLARELSVAEDGEGAVVKTEPFSLISEADRAKMPPEVEDAYPLAMIQEAMLYHMELTPDSPAYLNVNSWHLRAPYDEEALRAAVRHVVERHAVLRTGFEMTAYSQPLQLVYREAELPFEIYDIRHLSFEEQTRALYEFHEFERKHMFDVRYPSLMRFFVHRRTEESFQFSFTENHAIIDGWSTTSTLAEMFDYYLALVSHEPPPVEPPISLAYRDFVALELQSLASEETRGYWERALTDAPPARLPRWTYSTPSETGQRVAKLDLTITPELLEGLRRASRQLAVPLKTVLFAAHIKVMSIVSGLSDFTTGVTTNGRPEEIDGTRVRGNFLNTVPFRFRMRPGTWAETIRSVFEAEWEMLPHRRYPLGAMQRNWGMSQPLVETAFAYLHFHSVEGVLKPGKIEMLDDNLIDLSETNFSLQTLFIVSPVLPDRLAWLQLQFDSTETSAEEREAILGYYERVLQAIATDTTARHELQNFLSSEEHEQLLFEWNDTEAERPVGVAFQEAFESQVERTPDAVAVAFRGESLSYQQLNERANQLAHYLGKQGVGPETLVAVCMQRSAELLVGLLGVLKAGAAYVPLDPSNPQERISYILEDSGVQTLLTQQHLVESLPPHGANVLCLDRDWEAISQEERANPPRRAAAENLAYVIYTSGSTGRPKGTLITHRGLSNYLSWCIEKYPVEAGAGAPVHSSISFDLTVTGLFAPLLVGRRVEMLPEDVGIETIHEALTKSGDFSLIKITPAQLELLSRRLNPAEAAGRTRAFIIGGENLLGETLRFWQENAPDTLLINEYGPTETVVGCSIYQAPGGEKLTGSVPIGRPISNVQLYALNEYLQPVPIGVAGELFIGGEGVARGYLNRPELTAEKFIPDHLGGEPGRRLYRTGDLARYLPDGNLEFLGRLDHQVKIRGYRVETGEIEAVLEQHAGVGEAFVMAFEPEPGEKRLAAYLVAANGTSPEVAELRDYLAEKLPDYMIPSAFVTLDALPLTPGGKIDRRALPTPAVSREAAGRDFVAPQTESEQIIAQIWQEVLELEQVGIHDNFFDLGGDSFRVYEVHMKLRERLSANLSILDLFKYPTIEALSGHLSRETQEEASFEQTQDRAQKRREAANRRRGLAKGKPNSHG